ncbi:hypothetical protein GF415_00745 [Candidatus Micrarchaeota archaeon]|nr:hypothetical protein [Candidatus Micrarchaeota archaeon]
MISGLRNLRKEVLHTFFMLVAILSALAMLQEMGALAQQDSQDMGALGRTESFLGGVASFLLALPNHGILLGLLMVILVLSIKARGPVR